MLQWCGQYCCIVLWISWYVKQSPTPMVMLISALFCYRVALLVAMILSRIRWSPLREVLIGAQLLGKATHTRIRAYSYKTESFPPLKLKECYEVNLPVAGCFLHKEWSFVDSALVSVSGSWTLSSRSSYINLNTWKFSSLSSSYVSHMTMILMCPLCQIHFSLWQKLAEIHL